MDKKQTRKTLKIILDWMTKNKQKYIDSDFIAHGVWPNPAKPDDTKGQRLTFPLPLRTYEDFHKSLGQEFTEEFFEAYQDRGFGKGEVAEDGTELRFPENRIFLNFEGNQFIWRWMIGQGTAFQIIKAGSFEQVPYENDKEIVIGPA